jgi:hypothetical protein
VQTDLSGPEQVFRLTMRKQVANFGAVVLTHAAGVRVAPRLVVAGDENRLLGFTALPVDVNPYADYGRVVPAVGATLPATGAYDLVFDTPAGAKPGKFTFRFWVDDVTPPRIRVLTRSVKAGKPIRVAITDGGSGVDPASLVANVDQLRPLHTFKNGVLSIPSTGLGRGAHKLSLVAADYQETKNMENTGPILPNTRTLAATVTVR